MSGKHLEAVGRRAAVAAVYAMRRRRRRRSEAAGSVATVSAARQVVDVQKTRRVDNRSLVSGLGANHHVVLVLNYVVHWVPRTQAATQTTHNRKFVQRIDWRRDSVVRTSVFG